MSITLPKSGIRCPECGGRSRVLYTEFDASQAERQRICRACSHFFVTKEVLTDGASAPPPKDSDGGYPCPECGHRMSVLQTRNATQLVRRKRCCTSCSHIVYTKEYLKP